VNEKEFGNFSKWPLKELIESERSFPAGDRRGNELRAEIDRRLAVQKKRTSSINTIAAVIGAVAAIVSIAYSLDRGIYIGSTTTANTHTERAIGGGEKTVTITHKTCRYLFITGIAELPALGGADGYAIDEIPPRPLPTASSLHCRLVAGR
jgi:hypothetical protein